MNREEQIQRLSRLGERQRQVLRLRCDGLGYEAIGERLGIVERTVQYHMGNIYVELGFYDFGEESSLPPQGERFRLLFGEYCKLLKEVDLPPPPPEPVEPEPVPNEIIRMVEQDGRALVVWQPKALVPPWPIIITRQPRPWLPWLLGGMLLGTLLMVGIFSGFGRIRNGDDDGEAASSASITPAVQAVEFTSTPTRTSTPTSSFTPTSTPTPTSTETPTATYTPTFPPPPPPTATFTPVPQPVSGDSGGEELPPPPAPPPSNAPTQPPPPTEEPPPPQDTPVAAPSNLSASPGSDPDDLVISWQDNSDNEDGFTVRVATVDGTFSTGANTGGPNITSWSFHVGCGYTWNITLWAWNFSGQESPRVELNNYDYPCPG